MSTATKVFSVAMITCSVRPERINPLITAYVHQAMTAHLSTLPNVPELNIHTIDLATPSLLPPLISNEPAIPQALPKTNTAASYVQPSTQSWSAQVASHDAFVFVTPQYNWGYPAAVKHAIDLIYWEWCGKVAWVVSYGGHGGGKARVQLQSVLGGCKMRVVDGAEPVELHVPVPVGLKCIAAGELSGELVESWKGTGVNGNIEKGVEEMVTLLGEGK